MLLLTITSRLFQGASTATANTGVYTKLFIIAGSAYLVALALLHVLAPKLQPIDESAAT
jgi:hypothetical protein